MSRRSPTPPVRTSPSQLLMLALMVVVAAVLLALFLRLEPTDRQAQAAATPEVTLPATPEPTPTPTPTPTPELTPEPTPEPDWSLPVPEGAAVDKDEWFSDAVFIGDSRTDGLHLYSDITPEADFLYSTGITVFEVVDGKKVIRQGDDKISILDALGQKEYGKVYINLGVNELGFYNPNGFAETYGALIDAVRELQPDARLYVQSIIPVNTAKCRANDQRPYVTNENIASYNEALDAICTEKKVLRVNVSEALVDENGEVLPELSADGVHFQKEGYKLWLDYLATHTGT